MARFHRVAKPAARRHIALDLTARQRPARAEATSLRRPG
jgi:hypothetical protein